jgi:hypothetical protein
MQALSFQTGTPQENCSEVKSDKIDISIGICLMTTQKWR